MSLSRCYIACGLGGLLVLAPYRAAIAKPSRSLIALRSTSVANASRHISTKPKGGLILGSTVIANKEVFTLVDLNGGVLGDGDSVQIEYNSGKRPSYWVEARGSITRSAQKPTANSVFKVRWKQKNKTLQLRTSSGRFVSGMGKGKDIVAVPKAADPTTVFELIRNPKINAARS